MPFTDAELDRLSTLASNLTYDSWHDPNTPPTVWHQPDGEADLMAGEHGTEVTSSFTAAYEDDGWVLRATERVWATHALTKAAWLAATGGPGRPQLFDVGDTLAFHFEAGRDSCTQAFNII